MTTVRIVPCGPIRCAAQAWRSQGKPFATVVIKATFGYARDGSVHLADDPDDARSRDVHHEDNPTRSLADCSDLAPYLASGEVLFAGSAYVQPGGPTNARVLVTRGPAVLVDKRFVARAAPGPQPGVTAVRVTAENALGGPGHRDNPVGRADPLIVHAHEPARAALLGPVARSWRARADLLRAEDKKALKGRELRIEEGFDWDFFRAAPADQRATTYFSGDETIVLEGVQPEPASVEVRLPGARAAAQWMRVGADPVPIVLRADILRIDADRRRMSLTWRGFFETGDGSRRMVIAAGLALPGRPVEWPTIAQDEEDETPEAAPHEVAVAALDATGILHLDGLNAPTLPFAGAGAPNSQRVQAAIPHAPWAAAAAGSAGVEIRLPPGAPFQHEPVAPEPVVAPERVVAPEPVVQLAPEPAADGSPIVLPAGLGSRLLLAMAARLAPR